MSLSTQMHSCSPGVTPSQLCPTRRTKIYTKISSNTNPNVLIMRRMLSDAKEEEWVSAPAPRHRAAPEENRLKNSCSCIAIFLLPLRSISIILLQYFFGCFAVLLWILCSISLASFQYFARGKATQASCACAGVLTAARIHSHDWAVAAPTATAAATPAPPGRTEQLGFKPQVACQQLINNVEGAVWLEIE